MKWLFTCILLMCAGCLRSQEYVFDLKHWDANNGLSHRQVNHIFIDQQGFVWLSTRNGLNRFDGYSFTLYNKESHHLPFNELDRVTQDATGDLWLMGDWHNGHNIAIFNPVTSKVSTLSEKTGLQEKDQTFVYMERMADSSIFFGLIGAQHFYTWHPVRGLRKVNFPVQCHVLVILPGQSCFIAKSYERRLYRMDITGKILKEVAAPFVSDDCYANIDHDGALIVDSVTHHIYRLTSELVAIDIQSLIPAFDNTLQECVIPLSTNDLVWRQGRIYKMGGGLMYDPAVEGINTLKQRVRSAVKDKKGRIWMVNDFGLYQLTMNKCRFTKYFNQPRGSATGNSFRGLLVQGDTLYALNEFTGLQQADTRTKVALKPWFKKPFQPTGFYALTKCLSGQLAGFSNEYFFEWYPGQRHCTFNYLPGEQMKKYFWKAMPVARDSLLIGSSFGMRWLDLHTKKCTDFTGINQFAGFADAIVLDIVPFTNSSYWLCTNLGLYLCDLKKGILARYSSDDTGIFNLPANEFQHCYVEDSSHLWLATTRGLLQWNRASGQRTLYGRKDGLGNENIYAVYPDRQNRLWMSSDNGIMCFDKETHNVRTYRTEAGITDNEFNRISHCKDSAGNIYFGSLNGVTAFQPDDFPRNTQQHASTLAITSYQQFNGKNSKLEDKTAELIRDGSINLDPDDLFFTVGFSLLNYEDVNKNVYYWKIEGIDTGWNSTTDHFLRLNRLPYGDKILRIKAQSGDGTWSRNELQFHLHVIKPVYLRTWFVTLVTALLVLAMVIIYTWRVTRLQRENTKLDNIVKEKTTGLEQTILELKESFAQKDILMKEIHHRVKNNLQVISVLLKMQLSQMTDGEARRSIEESMSRVSSIALIHQYLYQKQHLTEINLSTYASELCLQIEELYRPDNKRITLVNKIPELFLDIDTAVPIGIILNELMVNSYKYAFNGRNEGQINLELSKDATCYILLYHDDGPGMNEHYDITTAKSLGMTIIRSLTSQLKGSVLYVQRGNTFHVTFKDTSMRKTVA